MCKICVEYQNGKLSWIEAWRNLREIPPADPHVEEVMSELFDDSEQDITDSDHLD